MTTYNTRYVAAVMMEREHRLRGVKHEMRNNDSWKVLKEWKWGKNIDYRKEHLFQPHTGTSAENPVLSGCHRFHVLIKYLGLRVMRTDHVCLHEFLKVTLVLHHEKEVTNLSISPVWKRNKKKTFNTGGGWGRLGQTTANTEKFSGESSC